jgi:hypothetical protein
VADQVVAVLSKSPVSLTRTRFVFDDIVHQASDRPASPLAMRGPCVELPAEPVLATPLEVTRSKSYASAAMP